PACVDGGPWPQIRQGDHGGGEARAGRGGTDRGRAPSGDAGLHLWADPARGGWAHPAWGHALSRHLAFHLTFNRRHDMTAEKGRAGILKAGDGGAPEPFAAVAGLRTTQISINTAVVDGTNKDSGGWRELLAGAGVRTVSVSGTGIFTGSAAEAAIRQRVLAGSI